MLAFVLVNRQRVFVRDPLAKVTVNGTLDSAYQVYINYSNDVLLERDDQKTGYHDHDLSSGAVYVCAGTLVEDRFHLGPRGLRHASRKRPAGTTFDFDAAYIHGVRHAGGTPATSIHCYSPPLWRMGYYDADEQGSLVRNSLSYLEEVTEGHSH